MKYIVTYVVEADDEQDLLDVVGFATWEMKSNLIMLRNGHIQRVEGTEERPTLVLVRKETV